MRTIITKNEWVDLTNLAGAAPGETLAIQNLTNSPIPYGTCLVEFSGDTPPGLPDAGNKLYTRSPAKSFAAGAGERIWAKALTEDVELEVQL